MKKIDLTYIQLREGVHTYSFQEIRLAKIDISYMVKISYEVFETYPGDDLQSAEYEEQKTILSLDLTDIYCDGNKLDLPLKTIKRLENKIEKSIQL